MAVAYLLFAYCCGGILAGREAAGAGGRAGTSRAQRALSMAVAGNSVMV